MDPRAASGPGVLDAEARLEDLLRELAAAPAPVFRLGPGDALGPYEVLAPLGRGGMGEVYRAYDARLRREVAIKLLAVAATREGMERFSREARILAALHHAAIPAIFDMGVSAGVPYLVMELLSGQTLRARLDAGPLGLPDALGILELIAEGLGAAHEKGVVHRDLKPENLMLCHGHVKLLDFGLAKLLGGDIAESQGHATQTGAILGTACYMAPEQVRGQAQDQRADVFALGLILHEMLTGRPPFRAGSAVETMHAILHDEPPPLPAAVPPWLRRLIERCLDKRPEERFADAQALLARLRFDRDRDRDGDGDGDGGGSKAPPKESRPPRPETRYAKSGEVHLAYQVFGQGPVDLVFVPGFVSQVEHWWEQPEGARFFERLGSFCRVVLFDKRGTGLSDRVPDAELPTLEQRSEDIQAVMDAAGVDRAVLFGISEGGAMAVISSVAHPERCAGLVLYGTAPEFQTTMKLDALRAVIREHWGRGLSLPLLAPSRMDDPRMEQWTARWERLSASPGAALAIIETLARIDITPLLPKVRASTLVLHRRDDGLVDAAGGRALAAGIAGARHVEFPGADHAPLSGGAQALLDEVEAFVAELGAGAAPTTISRP